MALIVVWLTIGSSLVAQDQQPVSIFRPAPAYPYALAKKRVGGHVVVEFIVEKDGLVRRAQVVESSNPGFNANAIAAVLRWQFKPGLKNGQPVNIRAMQRLDFSVPVHREVYPFELLQAGVTGSAKVGYWLDADKRLVKTEVLAATDPAFGKAAVAILADSLATSPEQISKVQNGQYEINYVFDRKDTGPTAFLDASAKEILKLLKKKQPEICGVDDLDAAPEALIKLNPIYPAELLAAATKGDAVVEFFIDRQGKAQLPRIVSATDDAFGYAAAQAAGQWQFAPPLRAGKPVIVRVRLPVEFRPGQAE